jgi:hypothetical protein
LLSDLNALKIGESLLRGSKKASGRYLKHASFIIPANRIATKISEYDNGREPPGV